MRSTDQLIASLKANQITVGDLTWDEFESAILSAICENILGEKLGQCSVTHAHTRGEIDITLSCNINAEYLFPTGRTHFIECKHYSRTITLGVAAKAFCAAIRHQPTSLTIASSTRMDPQVWDYAETFFCTSNSQTHPFYKVCFFNRSLEELLKIHPASQSAANATPLSSNGSDELASPISQILLKTPFSTKTIVASGSPLRNIEARSDDRLCFRFRFENPLDSSKIRLVDDTEQPTITLDPSTSGSSTEHLFEIPVRDIVTDRTSEPPRLLLRIATRSGSSFHPTSALPHFSVAEEPSLISDLQADAWNSLLRTLTDQPSPRVIFISGPGGVGKSHLVRRLARHQQDNQGSRTAKILARDDDRANLIRRFVWPILFPVDVRPDSHDPITQIAKEILIKEKIADENEQASGIIDTLINKDSTEHDQHFLLYLLRRLVAADPSPYLYCVIDAHRLDPCAVSLLEAMVLSFAEDDWSGIQFVFEYRDEHLDTNSSIYQLVSDLNDRFPSVVRHLRLAPCGPDILRSVVREHADGAAADVFADNLYRTTGGNALLIRHYLRKCRQKGILTQTAFGKWHLSHVPDTGLLVPTSHSERFEILAEQIRNCCAAADAETVQPLRLFLRLKTILTSPPPLNELCEILHWSNTTTSLIRAIVQRTGVMEPGQQQGELVWTHEYLRDAAYSVLRDMDANEHKALIKYHNTLSEHNFSDLLARAEIGQALGDFQYAVDEYNRAFEIAWSSSEFSCQKQALKGLRTTLSNLSHAAWHDRQIDVLHKLYWSEENAGSRQQAKRYAREALDLIDRDVRYREQPEREETRNKLLHHLWHLATSDLDISEIRGWRSEVMRTRRMPSEFCKANDRLMLACTDMSLPGISAKLWELATALSGWVSDDPDLHAVLVQSLGRLYSFSYPELAARLYKDGIYRAYSARQNVHNQLSWLANGYFANGEFPEQALGRVEASARKQGMRTVVPKILLVSGAFAAAKGEYRDAEKYFRDAEIEAVVNSEQGSVAAAVNNLAIICLAEKRYETFAALVERLKKHFDGFEKLRASLLSEAEEFAMEAEKRLGEIKPTSDAITEDLKAEFPRFVPIVSGQKFGLWRNLAEMVDHYQEGAEPSDSNRRSWQHFERMLERHGWLGTRRTMRIEGKLWLLAV